MHALEIDNVSKKYGNFTALNQINFNVEAGDFVGLLGVNGAGKTSLISSIAGINKFNGTIRVMGYDVIDEVVSAKRCLGVVPQELAYDPFLTVVQTLEFQSGLYGVKRNRKWIDELIERVSLQDKINHNTRALSGGMKRRLMVAQALVHKPPVIILDEPTAGVDVEIRKNLWEFIIELHKKGHTILLTTHYLEEVEKLCNKIIMIDKGKIIAQNTKAQLLAQAHHLPTTVQIETAEGKFSSELSHLVISQALNTFTLKLESSDQLLPILSVLQAAQVNVEDIQINRPSLEDIFISYLNR